MMYNDLNDLIMLNVHINLTSLTNSSKLFIRFFVEDLLPTFVDGVEVLFCRKTSD